MSRKKEGGEVRNAPLSIKATADLKARLEAAAERSGRSLAQEVERRLEQSLSDYPADRAPWSKVTSNFARVIGLSLTHIEQIAGRPWIETKPLCEAARATVEAVFRDVQPPISGKGPLTPEEREEADRLIAIGTASADFLTLRIGRGEYEAAHSKAYPGEFSRAGTGEPL